MARPPTFAMWPGRLPREGCEDTKLWWWHNVHTLRRCTEFGVLTPLARQRAQRWHMFFELVELVVDVRALGYGGGLGARARRDGGDGGGGAAGGGGGGHAARRCP